MINKKYSIIIPHKDIPELLQRCLDSIPRRDDIQIIVVDDNSNPAKVDFNHFPGMNEQCVEIYLTKEGKGAGYARNVGLKYVKGKWVLFADADDYFNYCLLDALDSYMLSNADIVFFNANSVNTDTYINTSRAAQINRFINEYDTDLERAIYNLRFQFGEPWAKMIKHDLIICNGIRFDETIVHNDTWFSFMIGYYAKAISVDHRAIYCVTVRPGSISSYINSEKLVVRCNIFTKVAEFCKKEGIRTYEKRHIYSLFDLYKMDKEKFKECFALSPHSSQLFFFFRYYPQYILSKFRTQIGAFLKSKM